MQLSRFINKATLINNNMIVGIVRYPGSNCDFDTLRYFENSHFIWHKEQLFLHPISLLIIPGGFAFGDRIYNKATESYSISPGTMAIESPITSLIYEAVKQNIPILGICNGFQILTQLGLLPGKLIQNANKQFVCKLVSLNDNIQLYIANSYGRYSISHEEYIKLKQNNQIILEYKDTLPEIMSDYNIAGVCNQTHTIFGMMPHPERNNLNFKPILYNMLFMKKPEIYAPPPKISHFHEKINALMQSEHISYKSTKKYLKLLHTQAPWVIQGPGENAGIIDIGDGWCIALRIESHNHPTYIDPFEGAATGVGGILRDIFTMGARPIALLDFLRFGTDDHSQHLLEDAIKGISYYGNCVGVPVIGGDLYKDSTYNKNPLVNIACLGIVKKEHIIYGKATEPEQVLIYVGGKTGNDGVGGATMASKSFKHDMNTNDIKDSIQKSDPFLEKLLLEACCEISQYKLAVGMQDMGAGGLLCASHEIIYRGRNKMKTNLGCNIYIDKIPIKYEMDPCNILISESQERMLIVATVQNIAAIFKIFENWDLEYSIIGQVTQTGKYSVYNKKQLVYEETMDSFKDIDENWPLNPTKIIREKPIKIKQSWEQYDFTVGNRTIKGPNKSGHYSILDIYENNKQLVLTWGENFDTCYQQMIILKAKPLCIVNCLNYGHPKHSLYDLVHDLQMLTSKCKQFNIPVVGGNISLYNSVDDHSIRPTPVLVMLGLIF